MPTTDCFICLCGDDIDSGNIIKLHMTKCGCSPYVHKLCLVQWYTQTDKKDICPVCRTPGQIIDIRNYLEQLTHKNTTEQLVEMMGEQLGEHFVEIIGEPVGEHLIDPDNDTDNDTDNDELDNDGLDNDELDNDGLDNDELEVEPVELNDDPYIIPDYQQVVINVHPPQQIHIQHPINNNQLSNQRKVVCAIISMILIIVFAFTLMNMHQSTSTNA
jgi:hypothetical protein